MTPHIYIIVKSMVVATSFRDKAPRDRIAAF